MAPVEKEMTPYIIIFSNFALKNRGNLIRKLCDALREKTTVYHDIGVTTEKKLS